MTRVIHQSTVRGDDTLGDGSLQAPYATIKRAHQVAQPGDVVAYDSVLGASPRSISPAWRLLGWLLIIATAAGVIAIVWAHPQTAVLFGGLAILVCALACSTEGDGR